MKIIKTINFENEAELDSSEFITRVAARAIVIDSENKIALLKSNKLNYYKLPGGWDIEIVDELGKIIEYKPKNKFIQESYNFVTKIVGKKGEVEFTEKEIKEGFELLWVSLEDAIRLVKEETVFSEEGKSREEREITILEEYKKIHLS